MKRRDFITKASIAAILGESVVISSSHAMSLGLSRPKVYRMKPVFDPNLVARLNELLRWMNDKGWAQLVKEISNLDLPTDALSPLLMQSFTAKLHYPGLDDFIGSNMLSPGAPERSLLYHLLASPRVRLSGQTADESYATLEQLDILENFIYSMLPLGVEDFEEGNLVLAVFAYEYRPAFKTPHECYADMVFSRAGFSRVGTQPISAYDRINRCFTNKPQNSVSNKEIAVTPARYGLFLARKVAHQQVSNNSDQTTSSQFHYLLPLRKIYKNDLLLNGGDLNFTESHLSDRLSRLWNNSTLEKSNKVKFNTQEAPFLRSSNSTTNGAISAITKNDKELVELTQTGASVLLSSVPKPLAWRAFQMTKDGKQRLRLKIPKKEGKFEYFTNRRYSTYRLLKRKKQYRDGFDIVFAKYAFPHRTITDYHAPRNEPMFFNIREVVREEDGKIVRHLSENLYNLTDQTNESYWVGLFEDNICEGCIGAVISSVNLGNSEGSLSKRIMNLDILPAYSVVTAPDFFPMIESYDLRAYKDLFTSGGMEDMSGAIQKVNPNVKLPFSQRSAFPVRSENNNEKAVENTILAIVSKTTSLKPDSRAKINEQNENEQTRSNFLPDSATRIFYPGWDITYSGSVEDGSNQVFYSTIGLGSPFLEDSKLCAAANGMWVAASPDTSRNFMPSIDPYPGGITTRTAIPLLDLELGYHKESPAVKYGKYTPAPGWDGEYGPFITESDNHYHVNFTDISRPDYVQNAINGKFDMSLMRQLTTSEVKTRMDCLKACYDKIGQSKKRLWLISAEKFREEDKSFLGSSLPPGFIDLDILKKNLPLFSGSPVYLYLFGKYDSKRDKIKKIENSQRMLQFCEKLYLCMVIPKNHIIYKLDQSDKSEKKWKLL